MSKHGGGGILASLMSGLRRLVKGKVPQAHKTAIHCVKRGMTEYNKASYAAAERYFRRAVAADGSYARAYAYLGNALYKRKQQSDAVEMWQRALTLEPRSSMAKGLREKLKNLKHVPQEADTPQINDE
jgi:Tfp pilus assembly protein PilF